MYVVYILQSQHSGRFYIGHTGELVRRVSEHDKYRRGGPWVLVYSEEFKTRPEAVRRELLLKSWKSHRSIQELVEAQR